MFDVAAVEAGAWAPGPYGPADRLGTYNEVGPAKRAAAMALVDPGRPVATFHLGETVFPGFPAFGTRSYEARLVVSGYQPASPYEGELHGSEPRGANRLSYHEERVHTSYNLGTKINGLHHCGVGTVFYNGVRGPDMAHTWGTSEFDTPGWGPPLLTRGLLVDVLALKVELGDTAALTDAAGQPALAGDYRVTLEDLTASIRRQGLPPFEPGDAVLIRTGWNRLIRTDPRGYLRGNPGPYLRECRWLAQSRPAVVGADTWAFEVGSAAVRGANISPCHQELFMRFGIRIAETVRLDELAAAGVDTFVFCHASLRAEGATASSSPPMAIANSPSSG